MSVSCIRCSADATSRCGQCKSVFYCSPTCQQIHWQVEGHRIECAPVNDRLDEAETERNRELLRDTGRLLQAHDEDARANFYRDATLRSADAKRYAAWKQMVARVLDTKRLGAVRWQMQTPLVGRSLLTTFSTARYDAILQRAVHPNYGLSAGWRRAFTAPLKLPDCMQGPRGMIAVNALIQYLYEFHHGRDPVLAPVLVGEHLDADKLQELARYVSANWAPLNMPEPRKEVRLLQPDAQPGDVLIWDSFHGSAAVEGRAAPHLVMFHDFSPRDTLDETTRKPLFVVQSQRPTDIGSGSKFTRSEAWNEHYNADQGYAAGGLAKLGAPPPMLAQYLAGNDEYEAFARALSLQSLIDPDDMRNLEENGFLVIARARLDEATGGQWGRDIEAVIGQIEAYMNWALWEGQESDVPKFDLRTAAGRADPRWEALSGSGEAAQRHFGDKLWLRLFNADGKTKSGTAQGGGTRLAGDSGMGPALNAYDLPAQQALRSSPALFSIAASLYGTRRLMAVPERFRLKVASKLFAVHTDRLIAQPPAGAVPSAADAARVGADPNDAGDEKPPGTDLMQMATALKQLAEFHARVSGPDHQRAVTRAIMVVMTEMTRLLYDRPYDVGEGARQVEALSSATGLPAPAAEPWRVSTTLPTFMAPADVHTVVRNRWRLLVKDDWIGFDGFGWATKFTGEKMAKVIRNETLKLYQEYFYSYNGRWESVRDWRAGVWTVTSPEGRRFKIEDNVDDPRIIGFAAAGDFLAFVNKPWGNNSMAIYILKMAAVEGSVYGTLVRFGKIQITAPPHFIPASAVAIDNSGNVWYMDPMDQRSWATDIIVQSAAGQVIDRRIGVYPIAFAPSPSGGMWALVDPSHGEQVGTEYQLLRVDGPATF